MTWRAALEWGVGIALVVLTAALLLMHKASGSKALGQAAVDAIEAAHKPKLDALNAQLVELQKDMQSNAEQIAAAKQDVANRRADLVEVYRQTGLTDDEVFARLSKMKV